MIIIIRIGLEVQIFKQYSNLYDKDNMIFRISSLSPSEFDTKARISTILREMDMDFLC